MAPDVCDGTSAVGESRHRIPKRMKIIPLAGLAINMLALPTTTLAQSRPNQNISFFTHAALP
jgi:hypothetical protein